VVQKLHKAKEYENESADLRVFIYSNISRAAPKE